MNYDYKESYNNNLIASCWPFLGHGEGTPKTNNVKMTAATLTGQLLSNPNVLAAFQEKIGGMVGKSSGYIER